MELVVTIDWGRLSELHFHLGGDSHGPHDQDCRPAENLIQGSRHYSPMQDVLETPVIVPGSEPSRDGVAVPGEIVDLKPYRVIKPTAETVPVFRADGVEPYRVDGVHRPIQPCRAEPPAG